MSAQYRPYRDEEGSDGLDTEQLNWSDHDGPGSIQIYEKTTEDLPFHASRRTAAIGTIGLALICLLSGFLIGYLSHVQHTDCVSNLSVSLNAVREADPSVRSRLLSKINAEGIKERVKQFSRQPRIPGSALDYKLAKQVADFFKTHGLDKVEIKNYSVLLSLPDENRPNSVEILHRGKEYSTIYSTLSTMKKDSQQDPRMDPRMDSPFCAYSPSADVIGDVVYVNYGQSSDYQELRRLNISLAGKILIAKQLQSHADEQVLHAQDTEAAGLLLFPDLVHSDWLGEESSNHIPNDAVRRDSLLWNLMGDPQTPHYPSTDYAYRMPQREIKLLPKIPVQPISTAAAHQILSLLGGRRAPDGWAGGFNFTYQLGGFQNRTLKLHLKVHNQLVNRTIYNVIGYIRGNVEPDRYVIIGNHRDSFSGVSGAIDAAGGTGALLELSKAFGDLLNDGWRPRRTIMFCSWGAEEHNLIGSTEWLEEHIKMVQARGVAYINTDIVAVGNASVSVAASPLLYQTIFNATKQVQHPATSGGKEETVYDKWHEMFPTKRNYSDLLFARKTADYVNAGHPPAGEHLENNPTIDYTEPATGSLLSTYINSAMIQTRPRVRALDMRSAAAPFFVFAGVPALEVTYVPAPADLNSVSTTYSLIHTQYDRAELIDTFDHEYKFHRAVTQILAEIVRNLADSLFLPFNLLEYAQVMRDMFVAMEKHSESIFNEHGISFDWLDSAIQNFTEAALKFHLMQDQLDLRDPMAIRRVNDQLLALERAFLDNNGLPRNPMKRHIVLSPAETGGPYDEEFFPGLMDEFILFVHTDFAESTQTSPWDLIRAHLSILVYTIQTAAAVIGEVA